MMILLRMPFIFACILLITATGAFGQINAAPEGYTLLFNGADFTNWHVPEGDGGHWRIVDGVIDYDALSEAAEDKSLWTEKEYGDFELHVDWRIKETPFINPNVPIVKPDGSHKKDANGREIRISVPDSDSGIYVRGTSK
ncbi:MAG TPA: DUF1080 domain-containing protein, partial [Candidatus Hydrogenedentes bacterium]|nr:DUF1080 domain-containing protein [Candidatus Hydrogenedentota bacterium]